MRTAICVIAMGMVVCGSDSCNQTAEHAVAGAEAVPVVTDVLADLSGIEDKVLALADAFDDREYAWRPTNGVRSSAEVFMHVATINIAFPLMAGHAAPPSTGMTLENLSTTAPAFESSRASKEEVQGVLAMSFQHLRSAIAGTAPADLDAQVMVFGEATSIRALWISHVGHVHEHLGQLIAYARMNGVVPPWSQ